MKYKNIKKVTIWGIGGKGAYYIAKFLNLLGVEVIGFDLKESENTKVLEDLGITINYRNPESNEKFQGDFYIYTNDIPLEIQKKFRKLNKGTKAYEVGEFYHLLVSDFESKKMSEEENEAFLDSNIAPLFKIDCNKMKYIGITGTDGKTTSCTMIYHVLKNEGFKPALITTVSAKIGDEDIDTGFHTTTPSSQEIYELIKRIEEKGCTHIIIEATSHGLHQGRLSGLKFDIVGYTNITKEHLDYHKTWRNYVEAKSLLIKEHLKKNGLVVLNRDDKAFRILKRYTKNFVTYSKRAKADLIGDRISSDESGISFNIRNNEYSKEVSLPILGEYNVSNFLLASSILLNLGISIDSVINDIQSFSTVEGRMQVLQKKPFLVIVDYAHTPNAVKEVLSSLREMIKDNGRLFMYLAQQVIETHTRGL
jgi:UDP-N-acetylmuramyl-tripeptide synthetase